MSNTNLETLIDIVLHHVKKNPDVLLDAYPQNFKRLDLIKLPNLLSNVRNPSDPEDCRFMT